MPKKPPRQKRHQSEQNVGTPPEFLAALKRTFHVDAFSFDLAATSDNSKADFPGSFFGPGSLLREDSLAGPWPSEGDCWLNPEFEDIAPWAEKCWRESRERQDRIFQIVPASIGTDWFTNWVNGKAHVVAVAPRLKFIGHKDPYPKDLILCIYSNVIGGFSTWRWKP